MGRMPRLVERGKKERRLGEPREVSWEGDRGAGAGPSGGADPAADCAGTGGGGPDARGGSGATGWATSRQEDRGRSTLPAWA